MPRNRSHGRVRAAALALIASATALAGAMPALAAAPPWGADYFPNLPLITQDGRPVRFYDDLLKDKVVAIELIYTHCKFSCPLETARLAQVQRLLGDRVGRDIHFYSITLDPKRDTPEVMKAYAEKFHAGPGWLFLTGKEEDIKLLARKLGLYFDVPGAERDGHSADLVIGNAATGRWVRQSAVDNPRFLVTAMERLLDGYKRKDEPGKSYAEAPPLSFTKGQYLFSTRCVACHTIGGGDRVGPDLAGVARVRDREWLTRYIAAPDRLLAEGDPIARALHEKYAVEMPNLRLGEADVASLVEYLERAAAPSEAVALPGTAAVGRAR